MSEEKCDRRVKMTKALLRQSLVELMKEKSIHSIKIKEICEKADINRSTFYKHYNTQYELYDDIFEGIVADISAIADRKRSSEVPYSQPFLEEVLKYVEKERELFLVLLSDNGCMNIGQMLSALTDRFLPENATELTRYCTQFIVAGTVNILWTWLKTDDRRSAHEVSMVITSLINHGTRRALAFASTPTSKN